MSMADRDGQIWYDGKLVPWRDATTHVLTHSLHYGMGVFEGVRAYKTRIGTAIFRLQEHTQRLFNSAKIYMMDIPYDEGGPDGGAARGGARQQARELLPASARVLRLGEDGRLARGNTVHVAIAAWPWGAYLGEDGLNKGIRVKTSSFARHHVNVTMVRAKVVGNYVNSILANLEAPTDGYDEALLLDTDGYVAEGAGENIFVIATARSTRPSSRPPGRHHPRRGADDGARPRHPGD